MKFRRLSPRPALLAGALIALAFTAPAATTNSVVAKTAAGAAAEPPAVLQSAFVIPKKPTEGKDPFFPNSNRVYTSDTDPKPKGPETVAADLTLKGISGTTAEPLAIINTTTFTTGEDNDVITSAGRMRVRCLEINMVNGTVLVQIGGERRELRLQAKK